MESTDLNFYSSDQLYERMKPALFAKQQEMKRHHYAYLEQEDIWNYLIEKKWKHASDLSLYQMVNDVFTVDEEQVELYVRGKLNSRTRTDYFEEKGE